jgi:hypothetical protein
MIDRSQWTDPLFNQRFTAAHERRRTAPETLTDADLDTIDVYDGSGEVARRERDRALAAARTKAAPPATARPPGDGRWRKSETLKEWIKRCPMEPAPLYLSGGVMNVMKEMNVKDRVRDERLAALEARLAGPEGEAVGRTTPKSIYRGAWQPGAEHWHNDIVTKGGALWKCVVAPTTSEPGVDPVCWRPATNADGEGSRS